MSQGGGNPVLTVTGGYITQYNIYFSQNNAVYLGLFSDRGSYAYVGGKALLTTGVTFTPVATGAVPEPAAWALMVGGFGVVGVASRRRRKLVVAV